MSETEEATPRVRPSKVRFCVHCQVATKGGKFAPGHDARWVAELTKEILAGEATVAAVSKKIMDLTDSKLLVTKLEKSLANQRGRAERQRLARDEAEAKELAANEAVAMDEAGEDEDYDEDEDLEDEDEAEVDEEPEPEPEPAPKLRGAAKKAAAGAAARPRRRVGSPA